MYFLLFYDYVENVVQRRAPYRNEHLGLVQTYVDNGELVLAGAFSDPVDGALLVFQTDDGKRIEEFIEKDPYVANGLVAEYRIRQWSVVAGTAA